MRLVDRERKLKELIEKDINSPEVYKAIFDLAFNFLQHKKATLTSDESEEIAYIIAEELYLKIYNGNPIMSWLGYISRSYHAAIRVWRKMNSSQIIDVSDNSDLEEAIVRMSTSSMASNTTSYQRMYDLSYFDSVPAIIKKVMDSSIYPEYTKSYMNIQLSVVVSIKNGKFCPYNLDEQDINYARMIYNKSKSIISNSVKRLACSMPDTIISGNYTDLQLFTISNAEAGEDLS